MSNSEEVEFADELIQKLYCSTPESERVLQYLDIEKVDNRDFFSTYMRLLCEIEMPEDEARYHYQRIEKHRETLNAAAGRDLGFRVAMLDYLLNINPKLECPKIIEFSTYTDMLAQTTLDSLTGVFNRRYFDKQLVNELSRAKRYGNTFSVLLLDIDDFKKINDTYGHCTGDIVLEEFAGVLKNHLRSEDVAARYGGEEFTVLLPQTDIGGAKIFSERLLEKSRDYLYNGEINVTFSGGIANYPHHGFNKKQLLEIADKGLYESKLKGKNQITVLQEERRDNSRYPVEEKFIFTTSGEKDHQCVTNDISITGISGESSLSLSPGEIINFRFTHPDDQNEYEVLAQIIWSQKSGRTSSCRFGARYRTQNRDVLYRLITRYIPADQEEHTVTQPTLFE